MGPSELANDERDRKARKMRYVVYGAGAVGGVLGARLHQGGHDVALIARGSHFEAIRDRGLRLEAPDGTVDLAIPVYNHPASAGITADDVVLLAMKSQDTETALRDLLISASQEATVACVQNGVANERAVLRMFARVYGVCVILPAQHLRPGVVETSMHPVAGILDVGRYPHGVDAGAERLAEAFRSAGFESVARPDLMRWKYRKLLNNLFNAVDALTGGAGLGDVVRAARAEGEAVLAAAGIDVASRAEDEERRGTSLQLAARNAPAQSQSGSSTWQSLARGTGTVEVDYLNGEIVLLGRLHGMATPVNEALRQMVWRVAREEREPRTMTPAELRAATMSG
jgi:2-dehydropantoate 2-reductase